MRESGAGHCDGRRASPHWTRLCAIAAVGLRPPVRSICLPRTIITTTLVRAASTLLLVCSVAVPGLASQAPPPLAAALAQVQAGQYREAVTTLEAAIRTNPKGGEDLYLLLAECYTQLADPAKAEATLRAGLRVYPAAPILERALGQLLFRTRYDSSEAGTLLAHAAKMLPRDPQARHYYAQWAYLNARERICVDAGTRGVGATRAE